MKDIRSGDVVHVRMLKLEEEKQWVPCREDGRPCSTVEAVFHVEPRALNVGDRVRRFPNSPTGHILHISTEDAAALVRYTGGGPTVLAIDKLSDLQPAGDAA